MTGPATGPATGPGGVADLLAAWDLRPDGPSRTTAGVHVQPVRTTGGRPASLELAAAAGEDGDGDLEAGQAHLALRHWDGRGAARLLRADPHRGALLLERLHPETLEDHWDLEACEVVAGLYRRLHVPAPASLRSLRTYAEGWAARLTALPRNAPLPRRMVEQAASLARDLAADEATDGVVVHGDLHYGTVRAADREPWLAVAPRPVSGDPHAEPTPMLTHRFAELTDSPAGLSVRDGVRQRFHALVDGAELDEDRARDWVVVRTLVQAAGLLAAPGRPGQEDAVTLRIAVAKAVQG
ncbi:streptomycin 6-kinase [Nocardioides korecus]